VDVMAMGIEPDKGDWWNGNGLYPGRLERLYSALWGLLGTNSWVCIGKNHSVLVQ